MVLEFDPNAQSELNERIQVLAVMHLQREPRYWINRIQE